MTTLLTVLGTRPEIIKLSPILPMLATRYQHVLVHTGQHYDHALDGVFFDDLRLRPPDIRLDVGSGSHGQQTARMLAELERIMQQTQPDAVIVQGDTNSTLAGGLAASKLGIPLIHLEAGCRSFNRRMPEELNRIIVDHCADLLLAADEVAEHNLRHEGIAPERIRCVGSTAIDACLRSVRFANSSSILPRLGLLSRQYVLCTIHRAENTAPAVLPAVIAALNDLAHDQHLVVPLHPRTAAAMRAQQLAFVPNICVIDPLGYLDLLQLLRHAEAVLTDSGGLQEEAAALNVPLLILRPETEWSYLVNSGKALLVGNQPGALAQGIKHGLNKQTLAHMRKEPCPAVAGAATRIVQAIDAWLATREDHYADTLTPQLRALAVHA